MTELGALSITTRLTADAQFDRGFRLTTFLDCHTHQLANTITIERLEWIRCQDLHFLRQAGFFQAINVLEQELTLGIVAAIAEGRLCQVVRAEAEEVGNGGNLVSSECCTRHFDHRTKLVLDRTSFARNLLRDGLKLTTYFLQLIDVSDERDHDLRMHFGAILRNLSGSFHNSACLHDVNFGEEQTKAETAQAEHGVHFAHGTNGL